MKKYTILGHVFELDSHAHAFLTRYIERIDETAKSQHISRDVLEDIKYSIIEKLYSYPTPITEAQVINLAEAIGDPEDIFDTKNNETTDLTDEASRLQRRFGKDKPMVRGVCYWISKSLNISVGLVRLIALVSIFIYGISIWMYPLLALFVPYKDKKSTSGSVGNLFFEFIRVIFWLGVIFALFGTIMTSITVSIGLLFAPLLSNQSLIALVPSYMYPVGIVSMIGLAILLVGSIGALLKKSWVSKTMALIAIAITIIGTITGISTIYQKGVSFVQNEPIVLSQSFTGTNDSAQPLTINIVGGKMDQQGLNSDIYKISQSLDNEINEMTQSLDIIASTDNTISAQIETTMKIVNESDKEIIMSSLNSVDVSYSGSVLNITLPNKLFNQKVPFSLIERKIIISVPKDQKIMFNNDSSLRWYMPRTREETRDGKEYMISCTEENILNYHPETSSWRCTDTTAIVIDNDTSYDDQTDWDTTNDDPSEDTITAYRGLTIEQAQSYAQTNNQLFRIVEQDGKSLPVTEDYRPGRINATVYKNIITDITIE